MCVYKKCKNIYIFLFVCSENNLILLLIPLEASVKVLYFFWFSVLFEKIASLVEKLEFCVKPRLGQCRFDIDTA